MIRSFVYTLFHGEPAANPEPARSTSFAESRRIVQLSEQITEAQAVLDALECEQTNLSRRIAKQRGVLNGLSTELELRAGVMNPEGRVAS